jgi:hypothetical protein
MCPSFPRVDGGEIIRPVLKVLPFVWLGSPAATGQVASIHPGQERTAAGNVNRHMVRNQRAAVGAPDRLIWQPAYSMPRLQACFVASRRSCVASITTRIHIRKPIPISQMRSTGDGSPGGPVPGELLNMPSVSCLSTAD